MAVPTLTMWAMPKLTMWAMPTFAFNGNFLCQQKQVVCCHSDHTNLDKFSSCASVYLQLGLMAFICKNLSAVHVHSAPVCIIVSDMIGWWTCCVVFI